MLARSGFSLPTRTTLTGDWADLLREHFVALDVSDIGDGDRFSGAVHSAQLAHVRVSAVQSMEQRIVRSNSLIKSDGADYLQIGMIRRGSAVVRQDDRECVPATWRLRPVRHHAPLRLADRGTRTRRHLGTRGVHLATVVPVAQRRGGHEPDRHRLRRTRGPEWPARSLSSRSCLRPHDVRRKRRRRGSRQRDRQPGQVRSSHNCATDHLAANQPLRIRPVGHRRPHRRPGPVSGGHRGIGQSLHSAVAPSLRRTRHDGVTVDSQPSTRRLPS